MCVNRDGYNLVSLPTLRQVLPLNHMVGERTGIGFGLPTT